MRPVVTSEERTRLQDMIRRMRYNMRVLSDPASPLYYQDTPERLWRYAFSNWLSSAHAMQEAAVSIAKKYDRGFSKAITEFVASDELLHYVREARHAEDHGPLGAGLSPAWHGELMIIGGTGRKEFGLYPIPQKRSNKLLPVPLKHVGEDLPLPLTPELLAREATYWWFEVSGNVIYGPYALPPSRQAGVPWVEANTASSNSSP